MSKFKNFILKYHIIELIIAGLIYAFMGILYLTTPLINSNGHELHWAIDDMIPVVKPFVLFYYSYYLAPIIFFWLTSFYDKAKFKTMMISIYFCVIIANIVYCCYQVKMVRPTIEGNDIFSKLINWMYTKGDPTGLNCCPSLHTVMGTFTAIALLFNKKAPWWLQVIGIFFGIGITLSTLFIKQHYVLDVICGFSLSIIVYFIVKLLTKLYLNHKAKEGIKNE